MEGEGPGDNPTDGAAQGGQLQEPEAADTRKLGTASNGGTLQTAVLHLGLVVLYVLVLSSVFIVSAALGYENLI